MEEHYDRLIYAFFQYLLDKELQAKEPEEPIIRQIIESYKLHFKGNGIYGEKD